MTSLQAVVFDAVGTLITPDPPAGEAYHQVGRRYGSLRSKEEVVQRFAAAFRSITRRDGHDRHRTDEDTESMFWRSVVAHVFDELPEASVEACFRELYKHFALPEAWRVYPDVDPTLRDLHSRGLIVAVASNFDRRLHTVFAGHRELAAVDRRYVSSEIGWRKPDRRFFAAICDRLRCRPGEVLYVGDEPDTDVSAASAAGLASVLLRREGPPGVGILTDMREVILTWPSAVDPTAPGKPS